MTARGFCRLTGWICLLSVLAYAVADRRPGIALLGVGVCGVAALLSGRGMPVSLPRLAINLLVMGASAYVVLQVLSTGRPDVTLMTDFLVWILLIKMFDRTRPRDEGQLLGLSIFVVIGAVLTDNSLLLGLMLLILTPLFIAAAIGLQLFTGATTDAARRASLGAAGTDPEPTTARSAGIHPGLPLIDRLGDGRAWRELRRLWLGSVMACGALSVAAFVLSPRTLTQQVLGSFGQARAGAQTEFRDRIDLGLGGTISTSDEPVLDLTLRDEQGRAIVAGSSAGGRTESVLLRGAVLDEYDPDARQWKTGPRMQERSLQSREGADATIPLRVPGLPSGEASGPSVVQQIVIRNAPPRSPMFCLWRPVDVATLDGRVLVAPEDMILRHQGGGRLAYTVTSTTVWSGRSAPLQTLDDAAVTPRVRDLALQIAQRAGGPGGGPIPSTAADRDPAQTRRLVVSIVNHLRDNYPYDLQQEASPEGMDPVEFFLFERRRGHCEYFAAALASMLRCVGVPARIVTGYAAGEYNAIAGSYLVRKADAHAWVEAEIRPGRWETFDATPPGSLASQQRQTRGLWAQLRQVWDALELSWVNNVVAFDAGRRVDLAQALVDQRRRAGDIRRFLAGVNEFVSERLGLGSLGPWLTGALGVGAGVLVVAGLVIGIRRAWSGRIRAGSRRRHGRSARPDAPEERAMTRLLAGLSRAGVAKPLGRPPLDHAQRLAADPARADLAGPAERLARWYYATRFGGRPWPARDATGVLELVEAAVARTATRRT